MISKTKNRIEETQIKQIFAAAKLGNVESISELKAGQYNAAYFVSANGKEYVLKVAPKDSAKILTYEKDIMAKEVAFYRLIAAETTVKIPLVYCHDESKNIIAANYFIMEKLTSTPLSECRLTREERSQIDAKIGELAANLHAIKGKGFGYEQNGLEENWYLAIKSMVNNLIADCKKCNKPLKAGYILLDYIEKSKDILMQVPSVFTHYDIWDGNVFYEKNNNGIQLALIDTERGFWGDCIGEFVSIEMATDFKQKKSIVAYNKCAKTPITFTREEEIRYNILTAYLGLIVYAEKFVRYSVWQFTYIANIFMAKYFFKKSFSALNKLL